MSWVSFKLTLSVTAQYKTPLTVDHMVIVPENVVYFFHTTLAPFCLIFTHLHWKFIEMHLLASLYVSVSICLHVRTQNLILGNATIICQQIQMCAKLDSCRGQYVWRLAWIFVCVSNFTSWIWLIHFSLYVLQVSLIIKHRRLNKMKVVCYVYFFRLVLRDCGWESLSIMIVPICLYVHIT